jgi:hypothetical protein
MLHHSQFWVDFYWTDEMSQLFTDKTGIELTVKAVSNKVYGELLPFQVIGQRDKPQVLTENQAKRMAKAVESGRHKPSESADNVAQAAAKYLSAKNADQQKPHRPMSKSFGQNRPKTTRFKGSILDSLASHLREKENQQHGENQCN